MHSNYDAFDANKHDVAVQLESTHLQYLWLSLHGRLPIAIWRLAPLPKTRQNQCPEHFHGGEISVNFPILKICPGTVLLA
jgi:hypothetical protein